MRWEFKANISSKPEDAREINFEQTLAILVEEKQ